MKLEINDYVFGSMKYLDKEIEESNKIRKEEIEKGINIDYSKTDQFYGTLLEIRKIQNSGQIPSDELYRSIAQIKVRNRDLFDSAENGYYDANIHYYLFESNSEYEKTNKYKDTLNKRILYFLKNADIDNLLYKCGCFLLNFPLNYLRFLEIFYDKKVERNLVVDNLKEFAELYGNDDEKEIANIVCELFKIYDEL